MSQTDIAIAFPLVTVVLIFSFAGDVKCFQYHEFHLCLWSVVVHPHLIAYV